MNNKRFIIYCLLFTALPYCAICQTHTTEHGNETKRKYHAQKNNISYFVPDFKSGETFGNIFSRTISVLGDGFKEYVSRTSGTGIYKVTNPDKDHPAFAGVFRYDGRPESANNVVISDSGKTNAYDGKSQVNTDASGLMFNSLIWGRPPVKLQPGATWTVQISQPWELGGPGVQKVQVMEVDAANHSVRLRREGTSEGFFDNDHKKIPVVTKEGKQIYMDITPGQAHWSGYTTFQNGLVISDELLVTRPVTLKSDSLQFGAMQREYILLNAMPTDTTGSK